MAVTGSVLHLAAILSLLAMSVECGAVFKLQLVTYSNPSGKEMDGDCCDTIINCGTLPCDHDLTLCLDDYHNSPDDHYRNDLNRCSVYKASTGRLDNRLVNLFWSGRIGSLTNPIVVRRSTWPGKFVLKVYIRDHDSWKLTNKYSDVDKMFTTLNPPLSRSIQQAKWLRYSIRGIRTDSPTVLDYKMMVYCEDNYYGKQCDRHCYGQDSLVTGHFTCDPDTGDKICLPDWEQPETNCKVRADDCAGDPCVRGKCIDGYQQFTCECPRGYLGRRCETEINECLSYPCVSNHTVKCVDEKGSYLCVCRKGYVGINCDYHLCQGDMACLNGGTCVGEGECICSKGYAGANCEEDLCDNINCQHGGKCVRGSCVCPSQYTGERCQDVLDPCQGIDCAGGRCVAGVCLNPCSEKPCLNRATCYTSADGKNYYCRCQPAYTGRECESEIVLINATAPDNLCRDIMCQNGGTCAQGSCSCPPGFMGSRCETPVDYCRLVTCQNGGTCYSNDVSFVCLCTGDYSGTTCQAKKSEPSQSCDQVSCQNGGSCVNGICRCRDGYTGSRCQTQVGCSPDPCQNGGQCYSNPYRYTCVCTKDWTGLNCDQRVQHQVVEQPSKTKSEATEVKYWIYIVIGVAAAFVLFLIILVVLLLRRSSRLKKRTTTSRGSFENHGYREDKVYQNVVDKRVRMSSTTNYQEENDVNTGRAPRDPPPRRNRPPIPERSVSFDGTAAMLSEQQIFPEPTSAENASQHAQQTVAGSSGYAYAKMDNGNKSVKTREVKTPKNFEEKFLAMKAAVDEDDLKS